jgi:hypothetical protein
MEAVEEAPVAEAPVHSLEAQDKPAAEQTRKPGSLVKRSGPRKAGASSSPTRSSGWNKFGRDAPAPKAPVEISSASAEEHVKLQKWEEERRCVLQQVSVYSSAHHSVVSMQTPFTQPNALRWLE